jgi:hypothetical protein
MFYHEPYFRDTVWLALHLNNHISRPPLHHTRTRLWGLPNEARKKPFLLVASATKGRA